MSYPTQPAFVHHGPWDDEMRSHPALKWMENYTKNVIDTRAFDTPWSTHHTPDFTLNKSDGTTVKGGEAAWAATKEVYAPFTANFHQPSFMVCFETGDGWTMIGQADLFANLVGEEGQGEKKVKDGEGKEWDVCVPSAFKFDYRKVEGGVKLAKTDINGDSLPAVQILMKRGVIKG